MIYTFDVGNLFDRFVQTIDSCPWAAHTGATSVCSKSGTGQKRSTLYTDEQRRRRDSSGWTIVQGILAPIQFFVFVVSLVLVLRYLLTGYGYIDATASIIVKTALLYTIMVTGSIWEREVFGKYLFAPAFFWEDAVSMVVIALHTAYLAALLTGWMGAHDLMMLALAAYAAYLVNVTQFVLKLRAARQERAAIDVSGAAGHAK